MPSHDERSDQPRSVTRRGALGRLLGLAGAATVAAALPAVAAAAPAAPAASLEATIRADAWDAILGELGALQEAARHADGPTFGRMWTYSMLGLAGDRDAAVAAHGEVAAAVWREVLDRYLDVWVSIVEQHTAA